MKLDHYLVKHTKINSEWIKDLKVRLETIKFLEENINSKLIDIAFGNDFLDLMPTVKATKPKINKWDYRKLKSFYTANETIQEMKRWPMEQEKIFANYISDKGLMHKIQKELRQLNSKKKNYFKMSRETKQIFFSKKKNDQQVQDKMLNITNLVIREMKVHTTLKYHFIPVRMPIIKKTRNNKCW